MSLTPTPALRSPLKCATPGGSISVIFDLAGLADRTVRYDVGPHLVRALMQAEETTLVARDLSVDDDTRTLKLSRGSDCSDRCIIAASPESAPRNLHDLAPTSLMLDTLPQEFTPVAVAEEEAGTSTKRLHAATIPALASSGTFAPMPAAVAAAPSESERPSAPPPRLARRGRGAAVLAALLAVGLLGAAASPKARAKASHASEIVRSIRGHH